MLALNSFRKDVVTVAAIAASVLCLAMTSSPRAQEATGELTIGPPQAVHIAPAQNDRASEERQQANFLAAMSRVEEHHISVPPTAATIAPGQRAFVVQPVPHSVGASDSVTVTSKIDVTNKAGMDYNYASPIAEPSSAKAGNNILVTFNWGAAFSTDGGQSFTKLDPFALFGKPAGGAGFCCDQLALYIPSHDLLVWVMQGLTDDKAKKGSDIRVMVARGADIAQRNYRFYDFTPATVGHPTGEWFDFPDLAFTNNNLFMSFNRFDFSDPETPHWLGSSVFRMPLDKLSAYEGFQYQYFNTPTENGEFSVRFTRGASDTMYWGTSPNEDTLLVRKWPDSAAQPGPAAQVHVLNYTYPIDKAIAGSEGPNGQPWLTHVDARLTAGWVTDKTIGFGWTSGKIDNADGNGGKFAFPHIRLAIIDRAAIDAGGSDPIKPIAEPHIWNSAFAFAYISAAPSANGDGDIGLSMFYGGPKIYPSAAVGVLKPDASGNWNLTLTQLADGNTTPRCLVKRGVWNDSCGKWGDYLSVGADPQIPNGWYVAAQTEADHGGKEQPKVSVTYGTFTAQ